VVDIEHMSELSSNDALTILEKAQYPVVSGHTGFRDLAFGSSVQVPFTNTPGDVVFGVRSVDFVAKERDRASDQVTRIKNLGGMIGLGTGAAIIPTYQNSTRAPQNCDGSSTVFAQILPFAHNHLA